MADSLNVDDQSVEKAAKIQEQTFHWDVWSVGVLLYRTCTGTMPFSGASFPELINAIVHSPEANVQSLVPGLPDNIAQHIHSFLIKDPEKRPVTLDQLILDLDDYFSGIGVLNPTREIQKHLSSSKTGKSQKPVSTLPLAKPRPEKKPATVAIPKIASMSRSPISKRLVAGVVGGIVGLVVLLVFTLGGNGSKAKPQADVSVSQVVEDTKDVPISEPPKPDTPSTTVSADSADTSSAPVASALVPDSIKSLPEPKQAVDSGAKEQPIKTDKNPDKKKEPLANDRKNKKEDRTTGILKLTVEPAYASIYIDGQPAENSELSAGKKVAKGKHNISVQTGGYDLKQETIDIAAGETRSLSIVLLPQDKGTGSLHVYSNPWAEMSIDGTVVGTAPTPSPIALSSGDHLLVLTREGFVTYKENVTIRKDDVTRLRIELEKVPSTEPPPQ